MIPLIELAPGYSIPRVILGAWQLSLGHSDLAGDRDTIFSTWDRALDHGLNTFDCADIYTGVEERLAIDDCLLYVGWQASFKG